MLQTQQTVLRRFWYPVMKLSHLADGPQPFTLLGESIVVWQQPDGSIACLKDRCCHRTAKLSRGFVEGENIVCGYHGWTFAADGACVRIPQRQADTAVSPKLRVPAYRAAAKYGYIWVALAEPLTDIPDLPEASQPGFRQVDQFYETWKIGALRLMENSFDAAHVAYVHRQTFGNVARPQVDPNRTVVPKEFGFDSYNESQVKVRGELAQTTVQTANQDTTRRTQSTWYMPFMRRAAIHYPHGLIHVLITCATPMTDDTSMILQWVYRNDTEADVRTEKVIAFDRAITLEDKAILESCDADVPLAVVDGEELHMPSDRPGLMMRRMLAELLQRHGEAERRAS
jgi:phenylpropionate dioxygenase-like ring-hydroxylating dioxygenase large terminal subunit